MSAHRYIFRVESYTVIDGDTVDCLLDLGLDTFKRERIRLWGINAPETRTKDDEEKAAGFAASNFLREQLEIAKLIEVESVVFRRGKYGRILGNLIADGNNLNVMMLMEGMAEPYVK